MIGALGGGLAFVAAALSAGAALQPGIAVSDRRLSVMSEPVPDPARGR